MGEAVAQFKIVDNPAAGMNITSAEFPAFTGGAGLTYSITYKTTKADEWDIILKQGIPADSMYSLDQEQLDQLALMTSLTVSFDSVPAGFGDGDVITYTFKPSGDSGNSYYVTWYAGASGVTAAGLSDYITGIGDTYPAGNYSPESYAALQAAIAAAQAVVADPNATPDQIAAAKQAVDDAAAGLVLVPAPEKAPASGTPPGTGWVLPLILTLICLAGLG